MRDAVCSAGLVVLSISNGYFIYIKALRYSIPERTRYRAFASSLLLAIFRPINSVQSDSYA